MQAPKTVGYGAPAAPVYQHQEPPPPQYGAAPPQYGAPPPNYGQQPQYGQPPPGYHQPGAPAQTGYYPPGNGAPPQGYPPQGYAPQYGQPPPDAAYAYPGQPVPGYAIPQQVVVTVPAVQQQYQPGVLDFRTPAQQAADANKTSKEDIDQNAWMCIMCVTGCMAAPCAAYVFCCGGGKSGCERPFTSCCGQKGCNEDACCDT